MAVALLNCATPIGLPPRESGATGALVIAITVSPPFSPLGVLDRTCDSVYFVRDSDDVPRPEDYFQSRFRRQNRFYTPDLLPGAYLPAGCSYDVAADLSDINRHAERYGISLPSTSSYTTYFSRTMSEKARVIVQPGKIALMGSFVVDMSLDFDAADEFQQANRQMLTPDLARFGIGSYANMKFLYRGTPRDTEEEATAHERQENFQRGVAADLAGTHWEPMLPVE
ncbi:MAG: hypothetical protein K1X75_14635 [Leptospirales bacterium]|nr:hypothetical protein [Leptospirales bacterium]